MRQPTVAVELSGCGVYCCVCRKSCGGGVRNVIQSTPPRIDGTRWTIAMDVARRGLTTKLRIVGVQLGWSTLSNSEQVLWVTMENPTEAEMNSVMKQLKRTMLVDRYDIVLTDDAISTLDKEELIEALDNE